jgi:hypothetical protein
MIMPHPSSTGVLDAQPMRHFSRVLTVDYNPLLSGGITLANTPANTGV